MYSLPRTKIFRGKADFQRVYTQGRSWANAFMVLYVMKYEDDERKVGFAAGKKLGSAPLRNRVKRMLRESYRLHQNRLCKGIALILVGRRSLVGEKCQIAEAAFLELAKKSGILVDA